MTKKLLQKDSESIKRIYCSINELWRIGNPRDMIRHKEKDLMYGWGGEACRACLFRFFSASLMRIPSSWGKGQIPLQWGSCDLLQDKGGSENFLSSTQRGCRRSSSISGGCDLLWGKRIPVPMTHFEADFWLLWLAAGGKGQEIGEEETGRFWRCFSGLPVLSKYMIGRGLKRQSNTLLSIIFWVPPITNMIPTVTGSVSKVGWLWFSFSRRCFGHSYHWHPGTLLSYYVQTALHVRKKHGSSEKLPLF